MPRRTLGAFRSFLRLLLNHCHPLSNVLSWTRRPYHGAVAFYTKQAIGLLVTVICSPIAASCNRIQEMQVRDREGTHGRHAACGGCAKGAVTPHELDTAAAGVLSCSACTIAALVSCAHRAARTCPVSPFKRSEQALFIQLNQLNPTSSRN
jgi:hypothetical protein